MALSDVVRSGVRTADGITRGLQVAVEHHRWIDNTVSGGPKYDPAPISRLALEEPSDRQFKSAQGAVINAQTKVTFLDPVEPHPASGRRGPVDARDKIILSSGLTGPIVHVDGALIDPKTNLPYLLEVYLG